MTPTVVHEERIRHLLAFNSRPSDGSIDLRNKSNAERKRALITITIVHFICRCFWQTNLSSIKRNVSNVIAYFTVPEI